LNTVSQENDRPIYLGQIKAEFFHPVFIGDEIQLKVTPGKMLGKSGYAFVDALRVQEKLAEMQIFYSVLDRDLEGKDSLGESS
jgi:acyl dehydratase